MQTNQSAALAFNNLLYQNLRRQATCSSALMPPGTGTTLDNPYIPKPAEIIQTRQSKTRLPCLCFSVLQKNTIKSLTHAFPLAPSACECYV